MFPFAVQPGRTRTSVGRPGGAQIVLDRAPSLKGAIDRVLVRIVKNLQTMAGTTTTVEGMLSDLGLDIAKDVVAAHGPDTAAALLESGEPRTPVLVTFDATLVHVLIELLCGGTGTEPPSVEARAITPIDQQFAQTLFALCASAIQSEWASFGFSGTRTTKIEGGLPNDCLGPTNGEVVVVRLAIGAFGLHGVLRLVLPSGAIERFRDAESDDGAEATRADPAWSGLLRKEVGQASVTLDAFLEAKGLTLSSLAALRVGQVLSLPSDAHNRVALVCDNRVLYRGELGQDEARYSLRVEEIVVQPSASSPSGPSPRRSPLHDLSKV